MYRGALRRKERFGDLVGVIADAPSEINDIAFRTLRWNVNYDFQIVADMSRAQRAALGKIADRPVAFLQPKCADLPARIVGEEVALFYRAFAEPSKPAKCLGRVPDGGSMALLLSALLLDRVLEIESEKGFVSGADAHRIVFGERLYRESGNQLALISVAALKYAAALKVEDPNILSAKLYGYNRVPASTSWKRRLPTRETVAEYLGIETKKTLRFLRHWKRLSGPSERPEWFLWRRETSNVGESAHLYKLYISPAAQYLKEAFQRTVETATLCGAHTFKVGADVYGVLRPDKLVAYFSTRDDLARAASQMSSKLKGTPSQGVPFSCSCDEGAMVSWGVDPPKSAAQVPWSGRSWRSWVTDRLAAAIITASKGQTNTISPWEFALDRLVLDGVDTNQWRPNSIFCGNC